MGGASESESRAAILAEAQLMSSVNGLVVHELGNSMQSLIVLVELTHDELQLRDPSDPGVRRLGRALDSIERLRSVLAASSRVRAGMALPADARMGEVIEHLLELVRERLHGVGLELTRDTADIDELCAPPALRGALLAALLRTCEVLRASRRGDAQLIVRGRVDASRLLLHVTSDATELELGEELLGRVQALLSDQPGCDARLDADGLTLWSEV